MDWLATTLLLYQLTVVLGEFERGFKKDFILKKGINTFKLVATDYAGNVTEKTIEVFRK